MDEKNQSITETGRMLPEIAELFKVLGDVTRLRIIEALEGKELCVQELETLLDMSQSAVSHQLHSLRQARLVRLRRDGKNRYYTLDDEHVERIYRIAEEHVKEYRPI